MIDYERGYELHEERVDLLQRYVTALQTGMYTGRIVSALVASSVNIDHWKRLNDIS